MKLPPTPEQVRRWNPPVNGPMQPAELKRLCRTHTLEAINTLVAIMTGANLAPEGLVPIYPEASDRLRAAQALIDRAYGKPTVHVEQGKPGDFENLEDAQLDQYILEKSKAVVERKGFTVVKGGREVA